MKTLNSTILFFSIFLAIGCSHISNRQPSSLSAERASAKLPIGSLKTMPGFSVSLFAVVPGARSLASQPDGTLFVSTGGFSNPYDRIYRIRDKDNNNTITDDEIEIIIEGLENPNGITVKNNDLYVAEISRLRVFKSISSLPWGSRLRAEQGEILPLQLPSEGYHGWKYLRFMPNSNWLYIPIGAPCNVCSEKGMFNKIYRIDVVTHKLEVVAKGQRNSVGFDFHPETRNLWFTDNGRDLAGDNFPPDELNEVKKNGDNFGFPYCHGKPNADKREQDKEFNAKGKIDCEQFSSPSLELNPHGAALGMRFITNKTFPKTYQNQVLIAEHGSWNRSKKMGYQVGVSKDLGTPNAQYVPLIWGWLDHSNQTAWGRPVDVELFKDGSFLISDDGFRDSKNPGAIYRVVFKNVNL